ncbi:MAG: alpha/beta hydrolase [Actinomycetota bacterium]
MPTTTRSDRPDGPTIQYETFGDATNPTLLLVNGLGSQLINWEPAFCARFVERGLRVVVFDNRDVGLTSKTAGPTPDAAALMRRFRHGDPPSAGDVPYTLADMAEDGFAVLDAVGAERAHIAGMSMGGMIVQRMAINRPERVVSLTSIMSTTGANGVGKATPEAAASLVEPAPHDRDEYIEYTVRTRALTGGSYNADAYWREQAGRVYDRMFHPGGEAFQIAAVASDGDRTEELRTLSVPSLVIHGRLDPLLALSGGEATAAAIPGADLLVIDEMGHDLPPEIWDDVVGAMTRLMEGTNA